MKLLDAYKLAARLHAGQVDKAGKPYIDHLVRVMLGVLDAGGDSEQLIAALLHDSIEDGRATLELLDVAGVPEAALHLVDALTRVGSEHGELYSDYIKWVKRDPRAVLIKRADLADNNDPDRLTLLEPGLAAKLAEKYRQALALLDS